MGDAHIFGLCPVNLVAKDPAAGRAMRIHAAATIVTASTRSHTRDQHMIAWLEHAHARSDRVNHAHAFMAQYAAGCAGRDVPLENMQIGAANRGPVTRTIASPASRSSGFERSSSAFAPGP
jgi:hypothetical protein